MLKKRPSPKKVVCSLYISSVALLLESVFFNHRFIIFDYQFDELDELGEPWRLLGNHPDGAFAKKVNNSHSSNS